MCFLEPRLQEGPIVDELVVIGKHLRLDGLVPLSLEPDSVSLVVSPGGLFGSLLGTAGVEGWVNVNQFNRI
jgi:hypothetical protein